MTKGLPHGLDGLYGWFACFVLIVWLCFVVLRFAEA
jgi:hypothetical protein